jgi:hypothetical protein
MLAAPTTHFVTLAQAILFRDAGFSIVWPQFVALAAIGSAFFGYALSGRVNTSNGGSSARSCTRCRHPAVGRPASPRNGGRLQFGMVAGFKSESRPAF